jgi:pimeloyl-ACP methyl ester carboxylesterase
VVTAIADPPPAASAGHAADRFFSGGGVRLRYRDEGRGPAVVLVHGWTLDLDMWNPQVVALRDAFRIVRLDRRGFGLSSGRSSPDCDVADLEALCRHLALGRVALVGMSQGARAVLGFAAAAPTRVACLVLDGAPDVDGESIADDDVPVAHYRALVRARGIDVFRREWAAHPLAQLQTRNPAMRTLLRTMIGRYPGTDLLEYPPSADAVRDSLRLEFMTAPALLITGDHDLASRVNAADALAQRLPHAERAGIEGAGHLPNLDNPDAYNKLVRSFLGRHTLAPT